MSRRRVVFLRWKERKEQHISHRPANAFPPLPHVTDRTFSLGVGVGNYRNANALATGAQYQIIDNAVIRVSASWNTEDRAVVGGGISYGW